MRRWWLLLLCLAIPFQGLALVRTCQSPCPPDAVQAAAILADAGTAEIVAADADRPALIIGSASEPEPDDCCNDAETAARTGEPCKTGQECSAPALPLICGMLSLTHVAVPTPVLDALVTEAALGFPASVWRPPAFR